jgi:hypothetical protein
VATHLGVVDEDQINNMSYLFFEEILEELGRKLNYDAVVNYAGNSFCEKSWDMIVDSNPMLMDESGKSRKSRSTLADFLGGARVATPADLEKMKGIKGNGKAKD